jgi:hypothetical protein
MLNVVIANCINRLLSLFPAIAGKAPTLEPYLFLPSTDKQPLSTLVTNNAGLVSSSVDALATDASNASSPFYRRSASCMRMGSLPGKNCCPAVTASGVLFALCLLNTRLERLSHHLIRGRHPARWARYRDGCGGTSSLW